MEQPIKTIAVVPSARGSAVQKIFRDLIERWKSTARIAGVVEEGHELADRFCGAGRLRSITDGSCYPIFQDLGPGSKACHLDASGAMAASDAVQRDITAGCDLVLLSKFGRLEAARGGLVPAFIAATETGVPILTSVSAKFEDAWAQFAAPMYVVLPADSATIDEWWRAARSGDKVGCS
jgi:hypothetical protein